MASRVEGPREARAAVVALRSVDADVRKSVNAQTRSVVNPIWRDAVTSRARTATDRAVLAKGARVAAGARPALVAASSSRPLRGGLVPSKSWGAWEFGEPFRNLKRTRTTRSRKGKSYEVSRRTRRQLPNAVKKGRVLYPAVAETGPRVFALWAQTAIRSIFEAFEKGVK